MPTIAAQPYEYNFPTGRLALIVIDMQRDFVEQGGFGSVLGNDVRAAGRIVPTVRRLIDGFRAARLPIIHTREGHSPIFRIARRPNARAAAARSASATRARWAASWSTANRATISCPSWRPGRARAVIVKPGKGAFYATHLDDI